ncbi:hypothetical protein FFM54_14230 [Burkholderia pseudomallei]|nr:hypothetical protein FFM54_14230 [Burkholderia pseudomallei]
MRGACVARIVGRRAHANAREVRSARCEVRGARCEVRGARGERREARGERREARGERREARGERREARGERREARGEVGACASRRRGCGVTAAVQRCRRGKMQGCVFTYSVWFTHGRPA